MITDRRFGVGARLCVLLGALAIGPAALGQTDSGAAAPLVEQGEIGTDADPLAEPDLEGEGLEATIGPPPQEDVEVFESVEGLSVTLRGLDKLTGEVDTVTAPVGESTMLWRMRVDVRVCYERTGGRSRESSAFLQVYDTKFDPAPLSFSGWMFASSPALSAMDHTRYDFWVLSCNIS